MNINLDKLKEALPPFPGILSKDEYFNSAVLIPLISIENQFHFLFEKRAADIRQGGEICFPGGEFDPAVDTSYAETAVRETVEEVGVKKDDIEIIGALDILVGPMGVTVDPFVAEIKTDLNKLSIDTKEVEKIFTVPVSFFLNTEPEVYYTRMEIHPSYLDSNGIKIELFPAKQLDLPERYHKMWHSSNQKIYVYKYNNEIIWGLTAVLIYETVKIIKSLRE
jgi:peroxisomal coenzyme A diphosphatase NUDT7